MHRNLVQGPVRVTLDYSATAITGEMLMPGAAATPIDVKIDAPVIGHLETALAAMPLAEGFETQVQAFQPAMAAVQSLHIAVAAAESVETAAGSFDALPPRTDRQRRLVGQLLGDASEAASNG